VIASFGLGDFVEMFLKIFRVVEGNAVDQGEHFVFGIAAPVSPGYGLEFDSFDERGVGDVGAATEVEEVAVPIEADLSGRVGLGELIDQFQFVGLAQFFEFIAGLVVGDFGPFEELAFLGEFLHVFFDFGEVFGPEGCGQVEVVVEPVFEVIDEGWSDGVLNAVAVELPHGLSEQVCAAVTKDFERFAIVVGGEDGFDCRRAVDLGAEVDHFSVDARGQDILHLVGQMFLEDFE